MLLALTILLLLLSAFFSGSEIAFVTTNRLRTEVRARRAGRLGRVALGFLHDPALFLTTTLVGNNVALVLYSTLVSIQLDGPLTAFWQNALGEGVPVAGWVLTSETVVASLLVLVFGEVVPKSLLRNPPDRLVLALALPLRATYWLLWPIVKVASATSGLLVKLARADAPTLRQFLRRDFEVVIRESRETGTLDLDEEETELLENMLEMRNLRAKECLVPRTAVEAIPEEATLDEARQRFIETGYSRLPVFRDNVDTIVGVVVAYDLFDEPPSLQAITREVRAVPESKPARDLLAEFLESGTSMAVVIDEYGGTAGIVTLEDLLEELFGEIRDEYDDEDGLVRTLDDGTLVVSAAVEIDLLRQQYNLELPEGDYETVGGLLLERLGAVPKVRESVVIEGTRFTVLRASAHRVETVRIARG